MNTVKTTIESIQIKNLFEIFDYSIKYPKGESVLIITGPNGFGKTQVLNILYNLFNRNFSFFQNLVFDRIKVCLNNKISIEINKLHQNKQKELSFVFYKNNKKIDDFIYSTTSDKKLLRNIEMYLPISRVGTDKWHDNRTDEILSFTDIISNYSNELPLDIINNIPNKLNEQINKILNSINVHLIKEQRLFKKVTTKNNPYRHDLGERNQTVMIETIETYSKELCELISKNIRKSYTITQELESSYPYRLVNEKKKVTKEEYDTKFKTLKNKQDKLIKNGLYKKSQKPLAYSQDDAKALFVFLTDLEKKLEVFDDLIPKLDLFTNILNERRFTYKSINISQDKGFYFKTSNGKELRLSQLSSGEQHEVVLLYELIFKTKPSILVLIDEPEISLHITWQKEFLDDLLKIIKIQNFQVLIATHSPSIINDRWDLVYNLEKRESK